MENRVNFIRGMSALEGVLPTKAQTEDILRGVELQDFNNYESAVLRNIISGWGSLFNYLHVDFTPSNILNLYKSLQYTLSFECTDSKTEEEYRGIFRETGVEVRVGSYLPYTLSTSALAEEDFLALLSSVEPTVEGILGLYLDLARKQYFANTNKRTAYLLCNYLLIRLNLRCMLFLPTSDEGNKEFLKRLGFFYLHPKQKRRLITYLKRYYLRSI